MKDEDVVFHEDDILQLTASARAVDWRRTTKMYQPEVSAFQSFTWSTAESTSQQKLTISFCAFNKMAWFAYEKGGKLSNDFLKRESFFYTKKS